MIEPELFAGRQVGRDIDRTVAVVVYLNTLPSQMPTWYISSFVTRSHSSERMLAEEKQIDLIYESLLPLEQCVCLFERDGRVAHYRKAAH